MKNSEFDLLSFVLGTLGISITAKVLEKLHIPCADILASIAVVAVYLYIR